MPQTPSTFVAHDASDLINLLPTLFGFRIDESVVAVATTGERRRFGFRLRVDLPAPEAVDLEARRIVQHLRRNGAEGAIVVAVTRRQEVALDLLDAIHAELDECGDVELVARVRADGERYWTDSLGSPVEGVAYEASEHHLSIVQAVAAGQQILPDRAALVERFAAVAGERRRWLEHATDEILAEVVRVVARTHPSDLADVGMSVVGPILDRALEGRRLLDADVLRVAAWVSGVGVRDAVWARITRDTADDMLRVLTEVSRSVVPPFEPAVLSLTAFAAWSNATRIPDWADTPSMHTESKKKAVIYARISSDRDQDEVGVDRQERECRALARHLDADVVEVLVDNDRSGWKDVHRRHAYLRLKAMVRDGEVDYVLVRDKDRIGRAVLEGKVWEVTVLNAPRPVEVRYAVGGRADFDSASGRAVETVRSVFAELESDIKAERSILMHADKAQRGQWMSGRRCYGYEAQLKFDPEKNKMRIREVCIVEAEAEVIRELANAILAGATLTALARHLNDKNIATLNGGRWRRETIRQIMTAARNAGLREHTPGRHGEVKGNRVADGDWPAIITPDEWVRLVQKLCPTPRPGRRRTRVGAHMLTGIGVLMCGECGAPFVSVSRAREGESAYGCHAYQGTDRCGRPSVAMRHLDRYVEELVVRALTSAELGPTEVKPIPRSIDLERRTVAEALNRARMDYFAGDLSAASLKVSEVEAERRLKEIDNLPTHERPRILDGLPDDLNGVREWWGNQNLDNRRTVLTALFVAIKVEKGVRGRGRFDPERIKVTWRA